MLKVEENKRSRAVFSLQPLGQLAAVHDMDIVREVAFVSSDGGGTWTAEA